jgi:hypothetical protein
VAQYPYRVRNIAEGHESHVLNCASARLESRRGEGPDRSPGSFIHVRTAVLSMAGILVLMIGYRMYQQVFGWSAGLDSTLPAFDTHWMMLLKIQLPVIVLSWAGLWSYIWATRDRHLDQLAPQDEIRRLRRVLRNVGDVIEQNNVEVGDRAVAFGAVARGSNGAARLCARRAEHGKGRVQAAAWP